MLEDGGPDGGGDGGQSGGGGRDELTREDPQSSRTETLFERGTLGGLWTNAELFPDGSWHLTQVLGPTADQLMWSHNQTASDGLFWLPDNIQASIASHLTDWGIDVSRDGINLVQSYYDYRDISYGHGTADDLASWIFTQETGVILENMHFHDYSYDGGIVEDVHQSKIGGAAVFDPYGLLGDNIFGF